MISTAPFLTLAHKKRAEVFKTQFEDLLAWSQKPSLDKNTGQRAELQQKAFELVREVAETSIVNQLPAEFKDKA